MRPAELGGGTKPAEGFGPLLGLLVLKMGRLK
jgi:hypothetical protein